MRNRIHDLTLLALLWLIVIPSLLLAEGAADSIVVWRIEPKSGVTEKDADSVSAMVAMEVGKISGKQVIGEAEMKSLLVGEEKKMSCGADDTACYAEIGASLGAPESVIGTLSKLGDYWILYLQRLNVRTATILGRAECKVKGDVNLLVEGLPSTVGDLFGKAVAQPAPAPAAASGVEKSSPGQSAAESPKQAAVEGPSVAAPIPQAPAMLPEPTSAPRALTVLGWSGVGLLAGGGAVLVVAGIAHWQANEAKKDYDLGKTNGDKGDLETWGATTIASYAVGGAALATGAALLIWDMVAERPVQAVIAPVPGGAMVSVVWRW
ncbi:MAG TPA: hypothetical protein PLV42_04630 [bacterium]|nr:hypothetical protein [bacterium]